MILFNVCVIFTGMSGMLPQQQQLPSYARAPQKRVAKVATAVSPAGSDEVNYGTLKMVMWYFEEGGVVL